MKTRSSKSVLMMALLLGSPAFAETVKIYRLDPSANILSEKTTESQRIQTARRAQSEPLSIHPVANDGKWMKIERQNGGSGYLQRSDLKEVEIRKTFVIRTDASLNSTRLANTSDAKKPMDLILTGHNKTTVEKDASGKQKTITWHQVVANGKGGWVAGGALNVAKDKDAEAPKVVAAKPTEKIAKAEGKKPAPAKPADPKPADSGWKDPSYTKTVPAKTSEKAATVKVADASGEIGQEAAAAKAADAKKAEGAKKAADEKKAADAKKADEAKKLAAPKVEQPNAKKASSEECVRTEDEFKASEQLKKAFGANNPFSDWEGPAAFQSHIRLENKRLVLHAGPLGELKGHPAKTPIQLCIDKSAKPYMLLNSSKYPLNGNLQDITLGQGIEKNTYTRKANAVR